MIIMIAQVFFDANSFSIAKKGNINKTGKIKVLMQGKFFQRCAHFLFCSVNSLAGKVNTRRMSKPDMNTDSSILVYKFRPERTGFNMYAE